MTTPPGDELDLDKLEALAKQGVPNLTVLALLARIKAQDAEIERLREKWERHGQRS